MDRRIFVSYSRRDQAVVLPLVDRLRHMGFEPWLDQRSIPVSVPWLEEIRHAVRSSVLFLIIESPHWRASTNCQHEAAMAHEFAKPILTVAASEADREPVATRIAEAYLDAEWAESLRARLLGDSGRWQSAGRPNGHLPRGRTLRELRQVLRLTPADQDAHAFIRAAKSAARGRLILSAIATLLTVILWLGWRFTTELDGAVQERHAQTLGELQSWRTTSAALEASPYEGVRRAIESTSSASPSFSALWGLGTALDTNLPISISNPNGHAPRVAGELKSGTTARRSGNLATYVPSRSSVDVTGQTTGLTAVPVEGRVTAMTWSPDGHQLAVAGPAGVRIVRISTGTTVTLLRGLDGAVDALVWQDPTTIVGRSGTISATWRMGPDRMLKQGNAWFMGLAANTDRSQMVALDRGGTYYRIDSEGVSSPVKIPGAETSYALAWVGDRWVIGSRNSSGKGFLTTLSVAGRLSEPIDLGACWPTNIASGLNQSALVVCLAEFSFLTIDLNTKTIDRTPVDMQPASLSMDQQGRVLAASVYGEFHRLENGQGQLVGEWGSLCWGGSDLMVGSPDKSRLLTSGASARSGCLQMRPDLDEPSKVDRIIPERHGMTNVRAATWSPDGSVVVLGFASGEVWFFDVNTHYSRQLSIPTGAEIRGLAFSADGSNLIVVTRAGEIVEMPATLPLATTADRIAEARRRVQIGIDGGLTP